MDKIVKQYAAKEMEMNNQLNSIRVLESAIKKMPNNLEKQANKIDSAEMINREELKDFHDNIIAIMKSISACYSIQVDVTEALIRENFTNSKKANLTDEQQKLVEQIINL